LKLFPAKDTFTKVALVIKSRRQRDNRISLLDLLKSDDLKDPADEDEELRRKLEENETLKKSEADELEKHTKKQETEGQSAEVVPDDEDVDGSPPPSDNEDEDENDGDEEDDGT